MSRTALLPLVALGLVASACENNSAPGNDREAQLAPPEPPAEIVAASEAIEGVENGLLLPQPMTEADLRTIPAEASRCLFSYTGVGEPVLGYGSSSVLKLNGKLVLLPGAADGRYSANGVNVTVRPVAEPARGGELHRRGGASPGAQDRVHRGDRVPPGLHRSRRLACGRRRDFER